MIRFAATLGLLVLIGCNPQAPVSPQIPSQSVLTAAVVSFKPNAEWDHYEDGSFETYDRLTLKLDSGELVSVALPPGELPEDSAFRIAGTRFTFALPQPLDSGTHLAWGAISNPTIIDSH